MRELNIGGKTVRVRATPLALLFYKQEFKSDLLVDMTSLEAMATDATQLDTVTVMQIIWAMAKADAYGRTEQFPGFVMWLSELDFIDFADADMFTGAMEEAANGFFRGGSKASKAQPTQ